MDIREEIRQEIARLQGALDALDERTNGFKSIEQIEERFKKKPAAKKTTSSIKSYWDRMTPKQRMQEMARRRAKGLGVKPKAKAKILSMKKTG